MFASPTCKCPSSYIISYSCSTTGCSMLTNWQYLVLSSIIAILSDFLSHSSSSAFCWLTVCIDESRRLWRLSEVPFFAFFCSRRVSLERFFNSFRHRLYSLVWSLSRTTTCRFHSSSLSCVRNGADEHQLGLERWASARWTVNSPATVLWGCPWWLWWTFSFSSQLLCVVGRHASELFRSLSRRLKRNYGDRNE